MDANLVLKWRKGTVLIRSMLQFRFVLLVKSFVSQHTKPVSRNTKFREIKSIFLRNTKLILNEILEYFVRKKLVSTLTPT